jgi:diguanylate cyclase (GGDEF)-like protein
VFFAATVSAGLMVGGVNYLLARSVVGTRLRALAGRMSFVAAQVRHASQTGDWSGCDADQCMLPVDSEDELGESARAFNELVRELERSHAIEAAIRDLFQTTSAELELATLARAALERLVSHIGVSIGAIAVAGDPDPRLVASHGLPGAEQLTQAPELRNLLSESNANPQPAILDLRAIGLAAGHDRLLVEPVCYRERIVGAVMLEPAVAEPAGTRRLLDMFTGAFGIALYNALLHERSRLLARVDPLTGCANRRSGWELLHEAFANAREREAPLGLLMIDLDHFKSVNDRYGHRAGDAVLVNAAEATRRCLRESDTLVRYGGEEFVAIVPGVGAERLPEIAERVRQAIEASVSETERGAVRVTASVGGVELNSQPAHSADELIERADRALYVAKARGRNCVVMAPAQAA